MPYSLYIIYSDKIDHYYIGISSDPEKRLYSHNNYPKGWTSRGCPWTLVFRKEFASRHQAQQWESWIKKQKDRRILEMIIKGEFNWEECTLT